MNAEEERARGLIDSFEAAGFICWENTETDPSDGHPRDLAAKDIVAEIQATRREAMEDCLAEVTDTLRAVDKTDIYAVAMVEGIVNRLRALIEEETE